MTARFDRSALALNVAEATGAYDQVIELMKTVARYTGSMEALNLDPVAVHGAQIDPFWNLPGLRQALTTARSHTPQWGLISQNLFRQLFDGATAFTPYLTSSSGAISQILDAAEAAGRELTAAEKTSIVSKLQGLQTYLERDRGKIETLRNSSVDFIRVIAGDYAALTTGAQDIDKAIPALEQSTMNASLQFMKPGMEPIFRMIIEEGARIRAKLVQLQAAIHGLVDANDSSQKAMQSLITAWVTVDGKFKSVIKTLTESATTKDAFIELPILLEVAVKSWQQLLTYFTGKLSETFF